MENTSTVDKKVYSILKGAGGLSIPVFKRKKPTDKDLKEYVVVKTLSIDSDVMQSCVLRVNYHVRDIKSGYLDNEKLDLVSKSIIALLYDYTDQSNLSFDFLIIKFTEEIISDEALNEHYSKILFEVKIINK